MLFKWLMVLWFWEEICWRHDWLFGGQHVVVVIFHAGRGLFWEISFGELIERWLAMNWMKIYFISCWVAYLFLHLDIFLTVKLINIIQYIDNLLTIIAKHGLSLTTSLLFSAQLIISLISCLVPIIFASHSIAEQINTIPNHRFNCCLYSCFYCYHSKSC